MYPWHSSLVRRRGVRGCAARRTDRTLRPEAAPATHRAFLRRAKHPRLRNETFTVMRSLLAECDVFIARQKGCPPRGRIRAGFRCLRGRSVLGAGHTAASGRRGVRCLHRSVARTVARSLIPKSSPRRRSDESPRGAYRRPLAARYLTFSIAALVTLAARHRSCIARYDSPRPSL